MSSNTKIRCQACRRKITLTYIECRCKGLFCGAHIYPDMHSCRYDHKKFNQELIKKNNPKVIHTKFEKI